MSSTELITEIPSPTGVMTNVELIDTHRRLHEALVFYQAEVAGINNELVMNVSLSSTSPSQTLTSGSHISQISL